MTWWTSSSGSINLNLTRNQAAQCSHPGQCDGDVRAVSSLPKVRAQLAKVNPATLRAELEEYGAWSEGELADHAQNLQRLVWLAAGDIAEGRS